MLYARKEKFPGGESLDEVRARAEMIWKDKLEQYTRGAPGNDKIDSGGSNAQDVHIAIISHGIFITELVSVILAKGGLEGIVPIKEFKNMKNTGWTRFSVAIDVMSSFPVFFDNLEFKNYRIKQKQAEESCW